MLVERNGRVEQISELRKNAVLDFPEGPVVRSPPANPGDVGSISGPGFEPGNCRPMGHNYGACALKPMLHNRVAIIVQEIRNHHS